MRKSRGWQKGSEVGQHGVPSAWATEGTSSQYGQVATAGPRDTAENMWHCSGGVDRVTWGAWFWPGNLQNCVSIEIAALGAQGISKC